MTEKTCTFCKKVKKLSCFSKAGRKDALRSNCKECDAIKYKKWKEKNRKNYLESTTNSSLKTKYGITLKEYDALFAKQKGICKICGAAQPGRKGIKRFAVDHCHKTNKIRGLLCMRCNTAIGLLNENPILFDAAKEYLRHHTNEIKNCNVYDSDLI
jgi:DNA-directed RNA polymerase beta' subunit